MQKILITGAKGMLGQDLCPILAANGYQIIKTDIDTMDITNSDIVNATFAKELPNYVIHCAAYTNVEEAEKSSQNAQEINIKGTENIAQACKKYQAIPIYISTDYVFDGKKNDYYKPSDIPNPINNYGKTKLAGEQTIQSICPEYYIVRTSWLYGIHGKNFIETMLSLAEQKELKIVNDQIGCPTWTLELSEGILKILKDKKPYGIYHICGKEAVSWFVYAKKIFKIFKKNTQIKACSSSEFPTKAIRPQNSILTNEFKKNSLEENLKKYMNQRERIK